jgi:hypothetical protein
VLSAPGSTGRLAGGGGVAWAGMSKSDHSSGLPGQELAVRLNGVSDAEPTVTENWCSRRLGCQVSAGSGADSANESSLTIQAVAASITAASSALATPSLGLSPVIAPALIVCI